MLQDKQSIVYHIVASALLHERGSLPVARHFKSYFTLHEFEKRRKVAKHRGTFRLPLSINA